MNKPWIMTQAWRDVVFLHWPISVQSLKPFIPQELQIDLFEGQAWIGIVPFVADWTRPRFLFPVPFTRKYYELNVRTYVRHKGRPGVFFFSLDANSLLAVKAASIGGFLPYRHAQMKWIKHKDRRLFISEYENGDSSENFRLGFTPTAGTLKASNHELWLTERYYLWTKPKDVLWRVDIEHTPWQLQNVHIEIMENSLARYLTEDLSTQPLKHFSAYKRVRFFPPIAEKQQTDRF